MNNTTEITGRLARTCTGNLNDGTRCRFEVGQRVEIVTTRDAGDGGDVSYLATGTIVRIGTGPEYGMVSGSTTAIVAVAWDRYFDVPAREGVIAARHLRPHRGRL